MRFTDIANCVVFVVNRLVHLVSLVFPVSDRAENTIGRPRFHGLVL
jgi:hypothetical protein